MCLPSFVNDRKISSSVAEELEQPGACANHQGESMAVGELLVLGRKPKRLPRGAVGEEQRLLSGFALLVHIFDSGLINQHVTGTGTQKFKAVFVVPFDDTV